jgi:hypothetical protein
VLAMDFERVVQVRVLRVALWKLPVSYLRSSTANRLSMAKALLSDDLKGRSFWMMMHLGAQCQDRKLNTVTEYLRRPEETHQHPPAPSRAKLLEVLRDPSASVKALWANTEPEVPYPRR